MTSGGRLCQSCSTLTAIFSILNNVSIRRNICLNKALFWQKWTPDVFFFPYFRPPCWCPSEEHQHGVSIQSSINLCGTLCQITRVRKTVQTWDLDKVHIYLSSITSWLHSLNGFWFLFWWRDSENRQKKCEQKMFEHYPERQIIILSSICLSHACSNKTPFKWY